MMIYEIIYEYAIDRVNSISDQKDIIAGRATDGWRLVSAIFNGMGNLYLLYFERPKQP